MAVYLKKIYQKRKLIIPRIYEAISYSITGAKEFGLRSFLLAAYSVKRKHAVQRINELAELSQLIKRLRTRIDIVLEIGTAFGGNLYFLSRFAGLNADIISIDLPPQIDRLSRHMRKLCLSNELRKNVRRSQYFHLLRCDSHAKATLDEVRNILQGRFVDLLFIDGDHTYLGAKQDYEMYSPLVQKGGLIIFHDIRKYVAKPEAEVDKLWNELKKNNPKYYEIFDDADMDSGYGIGVIIK